MHANLDLLDVIKSIKFHFELFVLHLEDGKMRDWKNKTAWPVNINGTSKDG